MNVTVSPNVWIRNRPQTGGLACAALVFALFWACATVVFATTHHPASQSGATGVLITAFGGLLTLGFALFGIGELRSGLRIGSEQVIVRGPWRTKRFAPKQVAGFAVGRSFAPCAFLKPKKGKAVQVSALMRGGWSRRQEPQHARELQTVCEQLDALLVSVQRGSRTEAAAVGPAQSPQGPAAG